MSDDFKSYYKWLNEQELYRTLCRHAAQQKPELPEFDQFADNTEDWKHRSGMRQGFDLAFALLTGYSPENYTDQKK
jgi:crotonobetainyl-CoA:carnitine CoA-transferase CaiB-like acyl-CoA transferase